MNEERTMALSEAQQSTDDLLNSLFYSAFYEQLPTTFEEKPQEDVYIPEALFYTYDNTLALKKYEAKYYVADERTKLIPPLMKIRVDSLFDSYFYFRHSSNHAKYFLEKLVEAKVDFKLPNSYALLQNDISFLLPSNLFDFQQEPYKVNVTDKMDKLLIEDSAVRRVFFRRCVRVDNILRFYVEKLVSLSTFDALKSVCFVDIENESFDDKMLIFPTEDPTSKAYYTLLVPFVHVQSNVGGERELFLTTKRLYKHARTFCYNDTYYVFLYLLQISLKRIFNVIAAKKQPDLIFHCNPYFILRHILVKCKAFRSSPIYQLFERGVLPACVLLCLEYTGYVQLVTDGFNFCRSKTSGFVLKLNQKIAVCLPDINGFRNAYSFDYADYISTANFLGLTRQNVRDGSAFKLGTWYFPAFISRISDILSGERAIYCKFDIVMAYEGIQLAQAEGRDFVAHFAYIDECGLYHGFVVTVSESEYVGSAGTALSELRCREVLFGSKITDAKERGRAMEENLAVYFQMRVQEVDLQKREASGLKDSAKCFLRGFPEEKEGWYKIKALKMADRGQYQAFRVLDAKKTTAPKE